MVSYDVQTFTEELDVVVMSQDEYNDLNNLFTEATKRRYGRAPLQDGLKKIILTDGYHRAELQVKVSGSSVAEQT